MKYLLSIFLFFFATQAFADQPVLIAAMRMQPSPTSTRITFILSKKTAGTVKYVPTAKQLIVTFPNAVNHFTMQNARLGGANVQSISTQRQPPYTVRFIFSVKDKVWWHIQFVPEGNHVLLRFDIISVSARSPSIKSPDRFASNSKKRLFTIVIDAGHGGKDTGAIGSSGNEEKHIVLAIAKRLAYQINQTATMRAVLTRDHDYFVPLRQRLRLARKDDADLFVAIHADAYFEKNAQGASVYALSTRGATSEAARWLAEKDNYSEIGGVELNALKDRSPVLRSVLIDLAQTVTTQDSLRLGRLVLKSVGTMSSLHYPRVEQAPFMVLRSPDIPSILIETGFISNPKEEKRLTDPAYQDQLAVAIFKGIVTYRR